jgi:Spy/CpxP family protein refolding chaperone
MISKRELVIAVTVALLIGIALGIMGGMIGARYLTGMPGPFGPGGHGHHGGMGGPPPLARLERALDLSPAQVDSIEAIFNRSRARFEARRDSMRSEIDAQLTPEQRTKWKQMESQFRHDRDGWHHPGGDDRP